MSKQTQKRSLKQMEINHEEEIKDASSVKATDMAERTKTMLNKTTNNR